MHGAPVSRLAASLGGDLAGDHLREACVAGGLTTMELVRFGMPSLRRRGGLVSFHLLVHTIDGFVAVLRSRVSISSSRSRRRDRDPRRSNGRRLGGEKTITCIFGYDESSSGCPQLIRHFGPMLDNAAIPGSAMSTYRVSNAGGVADGRPRRADAGAGTMASSTQ